ncbi:MAG: hypothetical protein ACP5J4_04920 [Anaerolineae bacterium]
MSTPTVNGADFPEHVYRQTFEAIYAYLEERLCIDPTFTPEDIRQFLEDAYVRQGNNWIGRGVLEDKKLAAVIAAYESFLAKWEAELEMAS